MEFWMNSIHTPHPRRSRFGSFAVLSLDGRPRHGDHRLSNRLRQLRRYVDDLVKRWVSMTAVGAQIGRQLNFDSTQTLASLGCYIYRFTVCQTVKLGNRFRGVRIPPLSAVDTSGSDRTRQNAPFPRVVPPSPSEHSIPCSCTEATESDAERTSLTPQSTTHPLPEGVPQPLPLIFSP
jgi:hypothetical protein